MPLAPSSLTLHKCNLIQNFRNSVKQSFTGVLQLLDLNFIQIYLLNCNQWYLAVDRKKEFLPLSPQT